LNRKIFDQYRELLLRWNETYNLTSITDPEEIQIKHFEDSLAVLPFLPAKGRLLDIGSGAGFPGIPIKIERPELEVVLLDSQRKRTDFCREVVRQLCLKDIIVSHGRIEDEAVCQRLGLFDVVISRATFPLEKFLETALPYCAPLGGIVVMRGSEWKKELAAATIPKSLRLIQEHPYTLRNDMGSRAILVFQKVGES